ncbi:uncharacterized protein A1O5_12468 [Cladophialophora psammophila CBS 110553]|uniref:Heterokaryon incompatibility domain-containing protein n=1 Tax=Cladophialophora psammophila CBS 110553 TaxID=1182543 RepID=W9VQ49_9EURO|nr:uncharacterized protein A1O5_12468 [Cladophialophora psammophila CBS 110553]EXJ57678.1 hypothetical protein A1O5_12468 [Cladophialophora psammophila CBS 110553]
MAGESSLLCPTCRSVDWLDAGLPRVIQTAKPDVFTTSAEVRHLDGTVAPAASSRLVESALFLLSLGTVQEVRERSAGGCPCCGFCLALLEKRLAGSDIDRASHDRVPIHVYTRKYGAVVIPGGSESQHHARTHLMCFNLSFHPDTPQAETVSFGLLDPAHHEDRERQSITDRVEKRASLVGRLVPPRFEPNQVKDWLEMCEGQWATTDSSFLSRSGKISELRVVDVSQRCIKTLRIEDIEGGYAALSYVWGVVEQEVRLTTTNLDAYSRPGGIPTLSPTVEDAMQVARSVGIRYFWADVISILQDDDEDKAQSIFDMDVIYTYSRLTIAAVAGTNCHEGLHGVSRDRVPLLHTTIAHFGLVEIPHQPERTPGALFTNLAFCEQQLIWLCRAAHWAEGLDVNGENFHFARYDGLNKPRLESSIFAEISDGGEPSPLEPRPVELSDAATLIECYTRRKLSYESDINNAFEGLMWYMSSMSPLGGFLWGLPELNFEAFLCWSVRGGSSATRGIVRRRQAFPAAPSWSWMAWLGEVSFSPLTWSTYDQGWRSFVKCFKYPTYLHRQGREPNDILSGYDSGDTVLDRPFDMWASQLPLKNESTSIVFWAECATVLFDASSLEIHYERHASSIRIPGGKRRLQVQNLCISQDIADDIAKADSTALSVGLVAVAVEGSFPSDQANLALDRNCRSEEEDSPAAAFQIWNRAVHCLVLSRVRREEQGDHYHLCRREGTLSMRTANWARLEKETKLVVLQ